MSRTIQTEVFKYGELSDSAKAKACDWYRQTDTVDTFWSESVIEDFQEVAKACGFEIDTARGRRSEPAVYWEGFSHQGQGASFTGSWDANRVNVAALRADRPTTYKDSDGKEQRCEGSAELHTVLDTFESLAREYPGLSGRAQASHRGQYMTCEVSDDEDFEKCDDTEDAIQTAFAEACTDLAHWLYRTLEREYEYVTSDECVAKTIEANEYEFTSDGERFG